jgi:UDP-N-acetylmuramate dehydrogenase
MKLIDVYGERVKRDEPLKNHTTYRLGGPADFYFTAKSFDELANAIVCARAEKIPVFIIGGGSNVLVSDAGFRGLVVSYAAREIKITDNLVLADAGAILFSLVKSSVEAGLTGLEWAAGIPGTIGGAIRGNAGAYGGEIKDVLTAAWAINLSDGQIKKFSNAECAFGYRESYFKGRPHHIVRAEFALAPGDRAEALKKIKETIELRRNKQPLEFGNAGSVFKSYVYKDARDLPEKLTAGMPPEYLRYGRIPAAWIIQSLGLKGKQIGGAQISEKHANYFVNTGNATAAEVRELIAYAKMTVEKELGIILFEEIEYVGF